MPTAFWVGMVGLLQNEESTDKHLIPPMPIRNAVGMAPGTWHLPSTSGVQVHPRASVAASVLVERFIVHFWEFVMTTRIRMLPAAAVLLAVATFAIAQTGTAPT